MVKVKLVTSPIPETGCGCGAQVPFPRRPNPHHHQLTNTEVQDFRGLHQPQPQSQPPPPPPQQEFQYQYQHHHQPPAQQQQYQQPEPEQYQYQQGQQYQQPQYHHHAIVPTSVASAAAPILLSQFASSAEPPQSPPQHHQFQQGLEDPTHLLGATVPLIRSKTCPTKSNPPLIISKATMSPRRSSTPPPSGGGGAAHQQQLSPAANRYTAGASPLSLECDYDVRPTELYKSIQSKKWDRVLELLESDNAIQSSIWVVRKEPNGQLRWRLLPLHAALIFQAPYNVIEALLGVYPAAAAAKDDQGMLPLHLALRNSPIDWAVVEELLTAHPGAVGTQDRKGRTPLQGATARHNDPALAVLRLYTQIAVARERSIATSGAGGAGDDASVASSSHHHQLAKLLELQQQVEHEREMWKQQIQAIESAAQERVQQAEEKQEGLQEQVTLLQAQLAMAAAASPTPNEESEIWKELCLRLIQQQEQALDLTWLQTVVQTQNNKNNERKAELDEVQEQARALMIMTPDTELRKEDILFAKSRARSYTPAFQITVESSEYESGAALGGEQQQVKSMRVRMVEEKKEMSPLERAGVFESSKSP